MYLYKIKQEILKAKISMDETLEKNIIQEIKAVFIEKI